MKHRCLLRGFCLRILASQAKLPFSFLIVRLHNTMTGMRAVPNYTTVGYLAERVARWARWSVPLAVF